jgi:HAD superfamily hydrolase (TIGR01457 family)
MALPARGSVADRYDGLFLDLDGVVNRGDEAVPGAAEAIRTIRGLGRSILFLTNNSSKTPEQVSAKLALMDIPASREDVLTSSLATAAMLEREGEAGKEAFLIGERGIREALEAIGIRIVDGEPERADLVVVGFDRSVDYARLRTASLLVQRGARLIATNSDASYPTPEGLWPGAGAILASITTTTGARALVVGKPARPLFEAAVRVTGAGNPLVVGDRLDTDISGAIGMGWDSLLVLSGASRPADLVRSKDLPTYVAPELSALLDDIPPGRFRRATRDDTQGLEDLLAAAGLSSSGSSERLGWTLVCDAGGRADEPMVATACLEALGSFGILRSVAVDERYRGRGLGMLAVGHAVADARSRDLGQVFLFTEMAAPFFERLGFRRVSRSDLPEPVGASPQAMEECAESAVPMILDLVQPS